MIVVADLYKTFHDRSRGAVTAVAGLSFSVAKGEIYGLLGPNGAGKTTSLRILATLMEPDRGRVEVAGVDRSRDPLGIRRQTAYVPAEAGLPDRLTPREVVRLFARIQGVPDGARVANRLLEELGASAFADRPCGGLSTGMKRRVVLARALVHHPKVLLLDEPTDGLDVPGRRQVLALIKDQAAAGRAIVLSSHIMAEVERVVDRVGVMDHGRLVAEGTLREVLVESGQPTLDDAFFHLVGGVG
ncbi:MAG: ABC transporter ATP-binding protein [Deltaproteobacteria bacterium]|nr:ABC transporter ATP-binding protein [Deltaproteobacteria bacterium]MBW2253251.1 ABC transporter ATP-binding protein [Deltaproteobacteria bacterium]